MFILKTNSYDGPKNADDLFAQIFTKIQHDKNTFIHFSTIKDQVSLRRQDEGSFFCEALTKGEKIIRLRFRLLLFYNFY